ncbi:MAG: ketose-bisphosphate aldolase [Lachnospiraceae bacterium]|nr:ketose-bisphosphate aldolase [Lachnospiraceae bacterium]
MLVNMKEILAVANQHNFAVPAFNTSSNMILRGVIEESVALHAPAIIAIHPDELSFVGDSFIKAVIDEANKAPIPVCIHLDHGGSYEDCVKAVSLGFTSVMIDASLLSFEENIAACKRVCEMAHAAAYYVSVEGEIGTIGNTDSIETGSNVIHYTDPKDAGRFVEETGIDALAVAIGTSHGLYPEGFEPKLRIDILDEIKKTVEIPLVLHGGSSNPDSEIEAAVEHGINKVNISSDIKAPFYQKCREVLTDQKLREPNVIYPPCIDALREVAGRKIKLFHADAKAALY